MKILLTGVGAFLSGILFMGINSVNEKQQERDDPVQFVHQIDSIKEQLAESKKPWLQFLDVPSLYCGVYHLAAGSEDKQSPHPDDEVYYVESGKAKFQYGENETECSPGTILFVPAKMEHRFHSIEEDITLLVFFARTPKPADKK